MGVPITHKDILLFGCQDTNQILEEIIIGEMKVSMKFTSPVTNQRWVLIIWVDRDQSRSAV